MKAFLVLGLFFGLQARAAENVEGSIWLAVEKAVGLSQKYGAKNVLFASDLDNTLLKTMQHLGGEPWFNWQDRLLSENSTSPDRIACDMPDLLQFFHFAIQLSRTEPVTADQDKAIQKMQGLGIPTMIVTARGDAVASQTFRELKLNKLNLAATSLAGQGFPAPYLPYEMSNLSQYGLTQADIEKFKLGSPRPILYQRGVLFSDGQNKGMLLRTFIHKVAPQLKALVFFDNDKKNTDRVAGAFKDSSVDTVTVRANVQDGSIKDFEQSDVLKAQAKTEFKLLRQLMDKAYHYPRSCALPMDKE